MRGFRVSYCIAVGLIGGIAAGGTALGVGCAGTDSITPPDTSKPRIDLSITKMANKDSVAAGNSVTFTITVANHGPTAATTVTGGDTMPTGLTYDSHTASGSTTYTPATGIWTIGTLAKDSSSTLTITATMASGTTGAWLVNRAGVLAAESDSAIGNNVASDSVKRAATPPPPPASDSEPQPPATALLVQNFTAGALASGTSYLYESYDRYTDNGNDVTLLDAGNNHYGSVGARTAYYNTNFYSLVTGRGGSGLAIRTHYSSAGNQPILETPSDFGTYSGAIVYQYYVRFPDANGFTNDAGWKFFEMWYTGAGNGRIQNGIHGKFHFNPGYVPADHSHSGVELGAQPLGPYPTALNDGNWHRVTILYRPNTTSAAGWNGSSFNTPSSRDGRAATWIDGLKVVDIAAGTAGVTPTDSRGTGTKTWCEMWEVDNLGGGSGYFIGHIQYPEYINGITAAFNIDVDDLKIWTIP